MSLFKLLSRSAPRLLLEASVNLLNRRSDIEIRSYYDGVRSGIRMYANGAKAQRKGDLDPVSLEAMLAMVEEMERAAFLPSQGEAAQLPAAT